MEEHGYGGGSVRGESRSDLGPVRSQGLVDVLDRILDKGLVVAGDIRIRLADVELLTIQIRLLVCSVDKAEQIGLDWWRDHSFLRDVNRGTGAIQSEDMREIGRKLDLLSSRIVELESGSAGRVQRKAKGRAKEE